MNGYKGQFRRGRQQLELRFVDVDAPGKIKISSVNVCHDYQF